ncbi:uncharacterized protein BDZ99DRAFT_493499 [Mytilinidion resinicola]|uniref:RRM domain-containing protein n=1 Tax=Mytilinidion resinicola TaxID=574789 RepID=A0A6A6ZBQ8_9PEZI|nr:uncharacterized protein BDZ99DRAFT_493499 [Mytilinidion resinicola]KAF2817744.1 hypothetical protein BDZ99DRAFT_493499 [Mytilinidion resinicola]
MAPRLVPAVIPRIQNHIAELEAQIAFLEEQAQAEGDSDLSEVYQQVKTSLKFGRAQKTALGNLETAWNKYFENNPAPTDKEYWTAEGQELALRELRQMAVWGVPGDVTPREIRALCPDPSAVVYVTAPTPINAHFFVNVTFKTPAAVDAAMALVNGALLGATHVAASKPLPKATPTTTPTPAPGSKRSASNRSPSPPSNSHSSAAADVNDNENISPERGGPSTKRARTQEPEAQVSGIDEQAEYEDISDEVTQRLEKQRLARERSLTPGGTATKRAYGEGLGGLAGVEEEEEVEGEEREGEGGRSPVRKRARAA